jgi:peptidoglycan/LPS O-acetylase OafA/YrhL
MKASSFSFLTAVLICLVGMVWGIMMAISRDHSAFPAHAHLNLLGWVSLFLFGMFYRLHPTLDASRNAVVQISVWIVGTVVLTVGVALVHTGHEIGGPIAGVGSLIVVFAMGFFGWLVFQYERSDRVRAVAPAE